MLSIYDADMQMKIGMAKLVPGAIWNFYYLNSNGPPGILGVQTDKERIGRQDFVDAVATMRLRTLLRFSTPWLTPP